MQVEDVTTRNAWFGRSRAFALGVSVGISLETVQYLPAMRVGGGGVFGRLAPASYAGCGSEALGVPCPVFFSGLSRARLLVVHIAGVEPKALV